MAISLYDYVDSLRRELNPPGAELYPNMTDDEAVGRMSDQFWHLRLSGLDFLANWTCDDFGNIIPQANAPIANLPNSMLPQGWYLDDASGNLGREIIQAIILFTAYHVCLTNLQANPTRTSYKAGPVEATTEFSATVYQAAERALHARINIVLSRLSDLGATSVTTLDAVMDATANLRTGVSYWTR